MGLTKNGLYRKLKLVYNFIRSTIIVITVLIVITLIGFMTMGVVDRMGVIIDENYIDKEYPLN